METTGVRERTVPGERGDSLASCLSIYAANLDYSRLSPGAIHAAKRHLIDALGCALGALGAEPPRIAQSLAQEVHTSPGATLLGSGHRTSPELAAFANGLLVRYLDYNDTYLSLEPCHPSDNFAAVLAAAEAAGAGGREVITAAVLAYEVLCRLCDAASLRARGWDHVTYVVMSSALGAGKALGLSQEQLYHALSLATIPNVALREARAGALSMWKAGAAANAARNGAFAAWLASHGFTGPPRPFEGPMGFLRQVSGPFELDGFGGNGVPFKIEQCILKPYPAEIHSQAAIEAALELRPRLGSPQAIERIVIETCDAAVDIIADPQKWHPTTRETADHSLPYLVAAALSDGTIGPEQFTPQRIADPQVLALVGKVQVLRKEEFSRQYPQALPTTVEVYSQDGQRQRATVIYPRGHPQRPLSDDEIAAKFRRLAAGKLSSPRIEHILERLWHLEEVSDISGLMALFQVQSTRPSTGSPSKASESALRMRTGRAEFTPAHGEPVEP